MLKGPQGKMYSFLTLRTNVAPLFCNYLLMFNSHPVAELNPLNAFLRALLVVAAVLPLSQDVKALSAAAVQQGSAGITPERFPSLP